MNKIFYIVPVYKVEEYLERCVESLLEQTYENIEIVLVDDGSPDNCHQMCDEFAHKHANITVIHKENGGLSDARNAGIMFVRDNADSEDYISFVDSDDYLHPAYSKTLLDICKEHDCGVVQCGYEKGSNDFFKDVKNSARDAVTWCSAEEALLSYKLKSMVCSKMFKAKLFDDVLFPLGVINEDEFTTYKAVFKAGRVAFTKQKLYYYFQRESSIMDNIAKNLKDNPHKFDFIKAYEERIHFFEEKHLPDQVLRTHEKLCTDMFLRYCEQMRLKKCDRDVDCENGTYMEIYRKNFRIMIKRKGIPLGRKLMYLAFSLDPTIGVKSAILFNHRR